MAYPTFASGDVLNASDMNAVGLWLVKTQTVGSGVSSVTITGAFSSTYDAYLIVDAGGTMSADTNLKLTLGSASSGYYAFMVYGSYAAATVSGANLSNAAYLNGGGGSQRSCWIEINNPYLTRPTNVRTRVQYATTYGTEVGLQNDNTSFTAFTLTPASGTMTGGTIRIYGYRN